MAFRFSILVVTNMFPTERHPTEGMFVAQQVRGLREIGLEVAVFHVDRTEQGAGVYFRMLNRLNATVQKARPALLHVMYGGVMADKVTRRNSNYPTVVTFHGSDLLGENFSGRWRKWISRYGVRCSRRAALKAQGVVVVSQRLKWALPTELAKGKVRVIPCGIDLERFRPMDKSTCQGRLGWHAHAFHILFASNNGDPVKRPELASAASKMLSGADSSAELHCMHGVPYHEVPVWINASDALILTSAQEGSPTVVKEALACGVPIVSVDVGDVAERIEGVEGCHLARPEPADLAAKLRLVQQRAGRVNGREKVRELSVRSIAAKLEAFYRETLALWHQKPDFQERRQV